MAPPSGQGPSSPHSHAHAHAPYPGAPPPLCALNGSDGPDERAAGALAVKRETLQSIVDASPELREMLAQHGSPELVPDQCKTLLEIKAEIERDLCIYDGALRFLAEQRAAADCSSGCTVCARPFQSAQDAHNCRAELEAKMHATELARDEANVVRRYNLCKAALDAATDACDAAFSFPASPLASPLSVSGVVMETDSDTIDSGMPRCRDGSDASDASDASSGSSSSDASSSGSSSASTGSAASRGSAQPLSASCTPPLLDAQCLRVSIHSRTGALTELRNQKAENLQDQRCFGCLRNFAGAELADYLRTVDRRACVMSEGLHHDCSG